MGHQADACHAHQIVKDYGIPEDRIILMMYDDVANDINNPFRGQLFNKPTAAGVPGVDVYKGCNIAYSGMAVTPSNFVKVLTGNASAPGPVLKSTSEDHVFINFVDHGGVGLIAFPHDIMSSSMLNSALVTMHQKNMYGKLVFYMEACDGGSMFENQLPPNMNIYVTTAANAKEYSYATYCPPEDIINGIEFHSCLGDLYSINWMENAESAGETETLETQYMLVKESTRSHVMQYGTMNFTSDAIGGYIRADKSDFLLRQERAAALIKEIRSRQKLDFLFHDLVTKVTRSSKMFFSDAKLPVGGCEC